jgi:Na+/H+ antiporter NhaD/arsenite permease-like protein
MNIPAVTLAVVLLAIAAREVGGLRIAIWRAMTAGALVVLLTGAMPPLAALHAIDLDVMVFLFGMFVVGEALVESRYLYVVAYELFSRTRSTDALVLALLFAAGLSSALLMNDTLAIVGTPLVLRLAAEHRMDSRPLLLALAFGITLGSAMSPIGNPQNLLIAVDGPVAAPFATFLGALAVPSLVNLVIAWGVLRFFYRQEFHAIPLVHTPVEVRDPQLARLAKIAVLLVIAAVLVKIALVGTPWGEHFRLSYIAVAGAAPILLFARKRLRLLRAIDWPTLVFFAAMFVLMASVWRTGVLQDWLGQLGLALTGVAPVLGASVLLSQLVSNVPLVALYLPLLRELGADSAVLMALAAGSTLAGNLFVIGAASNVIIIQRAERDGATLGFWTFARIGIPLTALNVAVYWLWLEWIY